MYRTAGVSGVSSRTTRCADQTLSNRFAGCSLAHCALDSDVRRRLLRQLRANRPTSSSQPSLSSVSAREKAEKRILQLPFRDRAAMRPLPISMRSTERTGVTLGSCAGEEELVGEIECFPRNRPLFDGQSHTVGQLA